MRFRTLSQISLPAAAGLACILLLCSPPACAGEESAPQQLRTIWNAAELYKNNDNPLVQKFDLVGRYHGQYWIADSGGDYANDWENRRMYAGFNARLLHNVTLEIQVNINDDFDPFYKGLYDAFVQWEDDAREFGISVGRLDYVYTGMERSTSSKKIKTMERSLVVNQVMPGEVVGIYLKQKRGGFSWQAGLFSGSIEDEFTDFSGGFAALAGLACSAPLLLDSGTLHLDYLYNNGNSDNTAFKPYKNIISLWHEGRKGALGAGLDLTLATGADGESDLFGLTLLPTWDLAENLLIPADSLQLALRYHFASSSDSGGLHFSKRYQQPVTSGRGDRYNSGYLGLNYYIYGQKLKLMGGLEYFDMAGVADDGDAPEGATHGEHGWNFISGVRFYF
jgi:hypothetical protein